MRALSLTFFMAALLLVGITVFALVARTSPIHGSARTVEPAPVPAPALGSPDSPASPGLPHGRG